MIVYKFNSWEELNDYNTTLFRSGYKELERTENYLIMKKLQGNREIKIKLEVVKGE